MKSVSIMLPYIIGAICFAVCFFLAILSANLTKYRTDHTDKRTRRIWFWVIGVVMAIAIFLICYFGWANDITVPSKQSQFITHTCISTIAFFVLFVVAGLITSKAFKSKKVQSWF